MAQSLDDETLFLLEQVKKLELMERRTKELVEQRKLERKCLEMECMKMERQKKYLQEMLRENESADTEYRAQEESKRPFHGVGNVLGAPVTEKAKPRPKTNAAKPLQIDPANPKGNIQIRLGDGSKLVLTLNLSHTIRDLKQEIRARQNPEEYRNFVLVTVGLPSKRFDDEYQTVSEAGLISSSVLQRFV